MNNHLYYTIIGLGWLVLFVYWIFTASRSRKPGRRNWHKFVYLRLITLLAILVILSLTKNKNSSFSYANFAVHLAAVRILGLVLFAIGFVLALWARHDIGANWGMPMSHIEKPDLISSGPYRLIRHPIYSGLLLALIGTCLSVSLYWLIVLLSSGSYFVYSALQEEKYMLQQFPAAYAAYRARTKMLIPFLV